MKKLLALILVLVLAFSFTTSAFAADNGTGTSTVTFAFDNSQISVTVPLTVAAIVKANGALQFGTARIENASIFPIKVTSIAATAESGWTMASAYTTGNDYIVAEINGVDLLATTPSITGTAWNMTAADGTADSGTDCITLTYSGNVHGLTKALSTTPTTAFTVVFTVEAGANS